MAHFEKPLGGRREEVVPPDTYAKLLELTKDQAFKDLLTTTWETGARPRIVYLTPKALEITLRLVEEHPEGQLFRNTDGLPWKPDATNCRFRTLKKRVGRKSCVYHIRRSWMGRLPLLGVDSLTVSILAGHADPSALVKHYQHLCQSPDFLRGRARRAG